MTHTPRKAASRASLIAELADGLPLARHGQRREITVGEARLLVKRWLHGEQSHIVIDGVADAYLARHNAGLRGRVRD